MLKRRWSGDERKILKVHRSACYRPERPVCRRRVVCVLQDIQRAVRARMKQENRTAEDIITEYTALTEAEKTEILAVI